ncbi:HofP DNA utilization family protein [Huaxiibacter chinensis]|uniref:HofP DNA utilization family protein n=1 Tax=Huaxiibacter chinensis TaxID=2899785 RepID=UPI003D31C148
MRTKRRYLLVCAVLMLTGMRDPFRPPDDRCAIGQLHQWRYHGMVNGRHIVGMVEDGEKHWLRIRQNDQLPAGWRVTSIDEQALVLNVGKGCEPNEWRWKRERTKNEGNNNRRHAADTQPASQGRNAPTSLAGGG